MKAAVFAGPTIQAADIAPVCQARVLAPVALGDVYRLCQQPDPPVVIGIIDGYFDGVPSVWHKEILWAMAQGIAVFGAASMGALRASELAAFGMRGVGKIFEAYRDGELEDDDEVALRHGPRETGYIAVSEPMVNIRATLERACAEQVIETQGASCLLAHAKSLFYAERTWPAVLMSASSAGLSRAQTSALEAWLPAGRVDQKRADALAMLRAMTGFLAAGDRQAPVNYHLEPTVMWARIMDGDGDGDEDDASPANPVAEELKLRLGDYRTFERRAVTRLALGRGSATPDQDAIDDAMIRLRRQHGLANRAALDAWLAANDLDTAAFNRLIAHEARLCVVRKTCAGRLEDAVLLELRLDDGYAPLAERARRKQMVLEQAGQAEPDVAALGPKLLDMYVWFFETRLGLAMPDDIARYAGEAGFSSREDFDRAVVREAVFCRLDEE